MREISCEHLEYDPNRHRHSIDLGRSLQTYEDQTVHLCQFCWDALTARITRQALQTLGKAIEINVAVNKGRKK